MTAITSSRTILTRAPLSLSRAHPGRIFAGAVVVAFALSALSLLFNHAIDYDPDGWIVYARETFGPLALNTSGFPAWKPLPVLLIGPFTLITRGNADVYWWLLLARAAGVLTVFGAATIAHRFGGWVAAALTAVFVLAAPYWFGDVAIGRDSAVSGALITGVFLAHYRGWYRWAVIALVGVALVRPEATPLLFLYGLWMWRTKRMSWWYPSAMIALIVALWFVPTIFHTGLSPGSISLNTGGTNTASNAAFPAWDVVKMTAQQVHQVPAVLTGIAIIAALLGLALARRRPGPRWARLVSRLWGRNGEELVLLGAAILWVLIVAAETQKGFSGNPRYLAPAIVLYMPIAAVVAVRLLEGHRQLVAALVLACAAAAAVLAVHPVRSSLQLIQQRDGQVYAISQELKVVKCAPGTHIETDHKNNAYLAELTRRPLQDTINWNIPGVFFRGGSYWFVYCSP